MTRSKRFLIALWDGGGVVPPVLGVARKLMARGHQVHVLADPTIEAEAHAAGCSFGPWRTAPHRTSRDRDADLLRDYAYSNRMTYFGVMMREFLAEPGPRWTADILAEAASQPFDAIVTEATLPWGVLAAEKLGLPSAALSTTILTLPTPGIPPMGMGLRPVKGLLGKVRDGLLRWVSRRLFGQALPFLNATRAAHGLAPLTSFSAQLARADRLLVLTSPVFDFTSEHVARNVRWVGPQLDDPTWAEPWRSPWPADDVRPLLLVGLSSTFQAQIPALRNIVAALATLPVRALVTTGPAIRPGEVEGAPNVVVIPSAPHAQVLPHSSVLVTHAGHGTTIKGLAAGVPMVCMPMGRDQNDNTMRVVARGAGVRVEKTASVGEIRAAVTEVLSKPGYREAARRMGEAIRRGDGASDVVDELEQLTRSKPAVEGEASARPGDRALAAAPGSRNQPAESLNGGSP